MNTYTDDEYYIYTLENEIHDLKVQMDAMNKEAQKKEKDFSFVMSQNTKMIEECKRMEDYTDQVVDEINSLEYDNDKLEYVIENLVDMHSIGNSVDILERHYDLLKEKEGGAVDEYSYDYDEMTETNSKIEDCMTMNEFMSCGFIE